ncbi:MAG: cation:proton antiporter regulatory subunit, partial [Candidatus Bipolaricaulia bacterium]
SPLVGRSLRQKNFRRRYELTVIAISRQGQPVLRRLADVRLRAGDVLLIQGDRQRIDATLPEIGCLPLAEREIALRPGAQPMSRWPSPWEPSSWSSPAASAPGSSTRRSSGPSSS